MVFSRSNRFVQWGIISLIYSSWAWSGQIVPEVATDSILQIVQSVPLETNLSVPGVATTVDVWVEMIKNAKASIDLAQFYVSSQPKTSDKKTAKKGVLEPVIEELERAGKRGVKIRLLLSNSLLQEDLETLNRLKKIRGVSIRSYDLSHITGGVHHAKYWIVDGKTIFVGSQNFDWRSLSQIHEMGVRVQDHDLAYQLSRIFEFDWKVAKTEQIPPSMVPTSQPVVSPFPKRMELVASPQALNPGDTRPAIQALVELIQTAKKVIRVQLLDYSPVSGSQVYWPDLDDALRAAALRGVKVQLMVSDSNSSTRAMDYLKSLGMISGVEVKMVTIPAFSGGAIPNARIIHSKYMTVDDEIFWVGTSNWSKGYFYNSRNVELILRKSELAQTANQIFQKLWASGYSKKIDLNL